jgi:hypothetical protein
MLSELDSSRGSGWGLSCELLAAVCSGIMRLDIWSEDMWCGGSPQTGAPDVRNLDFLEGGVHLEFTLWNR